MNICGYCASLSIFFWLDKYPSIEAGATFRVLCLMLLLRTDFAINIVLAVSKRGWRTSPSSNAAKLTQVVLLTVVTSKLSSNTRLGLGK